MVQALTNTFGNQPESAASDGDLARAALALLSEDPAYREPIRLMAENSSTGNRPQQYIEPSTIALTTAVLLALQTRIKFKADQSGKWSVELDKKSAGDSRIKLVVRYRLLGFSKIAITT